MPKLYGPDGRPLASMRPAPQGAGKFRGPARLPGPHKASMRPAPQGAGKLHRRVDGGPGDHASMRPAPQGAGKPRQRKHAARSGMCFNEAGPARGRKSPRRGQLRTDPRGASMRPAPQGAGKARLARQGPCLRGASMRPAPQGAGKIRPCAISSELDPGFNEAGPARGRKSQRSRFTFGPTALQ